MRGVTGEQGNRGTEEKNHFPFEETETAGGAPFPTCNLNKS